MNRTLFLALSLSMMASVVYASQSRIVESEGSACMGDDKSRKQTEQAAMAEAKRKAVESVRTYITSETRVKDFELVKDLVAAYANASVSVVQDLAKEWYKDPLSGDCCRVRIKAEVTPDEKAMVAAARRQEATDDPSAPLSIRVWTSSRDYARGEKIRIFIKGNKPFHAKVLYRDAGGEMVQLLPNPYRKENYFNGGVIYEIPSGDDKFELAVSPPFGEESVIVQASTVPLGEIELSETGNVYKVMTNQAAVGRATRGVNLKGRTADKASSQAEFAEETASLKTGKK